MGGENTKRIEWVAVDKRLQQFLEAKKANERMVTGKVETRRPQPRKHLEGSYRMELCNLSMKTLEKD